MTMQKCECITKITTHFTHFFEFSSLPIYPTKCKNLSVESLMLKVSKFQLHSLEKLFP